MLYAHWLELGVLCDEIAVFFCLADALLVVPAPEPEREPAKEDDDETGKHCGGLFSHKLRFEPGFDSLRFQFAQIARDESSIALAQQIGERGLAPGIVERFPVCGHGRELRAVIQAGRIGVKERRENFVPWPSRNPPGQLLKGDRGVLRIPVLPSVKKRR